MSDLKGTLSGDLEEEEAPPQPAPGNGSHADAGRGTLSGDAGKGTLSGDAGKGTLSGDAGKGTLSGGASPTGTLAGDFREPDEMAAARAAERVDAPDLEVEREVGRGGMGVVWLAKQVTLDRTVAVKTLKSELASGPAADKFEAEALVTGRLQHPNIPPVHVFGRDGTGRPFLCMKLVKGVEWGKLLEPRTPEEKERAAKMDLRAHLEIIERVCEAVGFAHSHGIIHRDLKPENVMVGEFGEVLVMDWGIALDLAKRPPPSGKPSGPRAPVGTPAYLPPEMARADEQAMGPWTDVYLLGGMLYELLTGTPPHRGESLMEVLLAAQQGEIEPPQKRTPGRELPEMLVEIAMKALDADPAKRYQTAIDFEHAIVEYLRNEASLKISKAALEALGAVESDIAAKTRTATDIYPAMAACVAELRQAEKLWSGNKAASDGLTRARLGYADYAIGQGDLSLAEAQLGLVPEEDPRRRALEKRIAAIRAARELRTQIRNLIFCVLAAMLLIVGWIAREQYQARQRKNAASALVEGMGWLAPSEKIAAYSRAVAVDPTWPEAQTDLARAYLDRGFEYYLAADPAKGAADLEAALGPFAKAVELQPGNATAYSDRGYGNEMRGDVAAALRDYRKAVELDETAYTCHASIAFAERRFEDAEVAAGKSIENEPNETDYFVRAMARFIQEKNEEALKDIVRATGLSVRGEDEWYDALHGAILIASGRESEGADRLVMGIRLHRQAPHVMPLLAYLAAKHGDLERARALEAKARERHREYARCYLAFDPVWSAAAHARGSSEEIGKALALVLDLATVVPKETHRLLALRRQGEERYRRGEYELALADAQRVLGEEPTDGSARLLRAECYIALGHAQAARSDLELVERLAPNRAADAADVLRKLEEASKKAP